MEINNQEIQDGNKLIAEFMNEKVSKSGLGIVAPSGFDLIFGYDSSWDWLMPVVEKIRTINRGSASSEIYLAISKVDRLSAHEEVVNFIKWYNKVNGI